MVSKNSTINLLYKNTVVNETVRSLRRWSLVLVGVYIVLLLGLFAASLVFGMLKNNVVTQNSTLETEINNFKEREGLLMTLKNRLDLSKTVYAQSSVSQEQIKKLASSMPPGVFLDSIQSEEGNILSLNVRAATSQSLAIFMNQLRASNFSYLALGNITLDPSGEYTLKVDVR